MSQTTTIPVRLDRISASPSSHSNNADAPSSKNSKNDGDSLNIRLNALAGHSPPPPPNGGYGWVCTTCVALINAHSWGLNASYSIFLAHYLANNTFPGTTPLQYAFVGSLSVSCALLASPIATTCVRRYGTKPTLSGGVVLQTVSLIAASFASKIWHLFPTQGLLFGLGMGFLFTPSASIIPQWFTTRRSLANGCSSCGSSIGGLVYSFATGAMIRSFGLAWTFRVLGIIALLVNAVSTALIKDRNAVIGSSQVAFDTKLLKRAEFLLLLGFGCFSIFGYVILNFSLADYATKVGLSTSQSVLVGSFFSLGQAIGRPLIGYFSDRTGRINMSTVSTLLAGIFCLVVWTQAKTYGVLILFSIISGCVAGTFWTTIGPVTTEVVGLRTIPSALCMVWLVVVPAALFSEPIALQIVAGTGSYFGAQLFAGFMYILAGVCVLVLRGWKISETDEITRILGVDARQIDRANMEMNEELSGRGSKAGRKMMMKTWWKVRKV